MDVLIAGFVLGAAHFLLGGLWYSPIGFGTIWMRGLGINRVDIAEAATNVRAGLAVSAILSLLQTAAVILILVGMGGVSAPGGAAIGALVAIAFAFLPMAKDRVWADRPWSVILVDAGYEVLGAAMVGGLAAWWLW